MPYNQIRNSLPADIDLDFVESCPVCEALKVHEPIGEVREHEYHGTTKSTFPVYQCPECNAIYLSPRPALSNLRRIYPSDYYSYNVAMNAPATRATDRPMLHRIVYRRALGRYRRDLKQWWSSRPKEIPVRILDIGCSVGDQLDMFADIFPGAKTSGVEMDKISVEKAKARGHTVYEGRFEEIVIDADRFHIIHASHVIEHVGNPVAFLRKCRDLILPGGVILIETPNTDCFGFRVLCKRHWGGYHAPRHFCLFSPRTFDVIADRIGCQVVKHDTRFIPNYWVWSLHSMCQDWVGSVIADKLFPPVKVSYGGVYALLLLGSFAVLGNAIKTLTGQGNALAVIIKESE